MPFQTKSIVLSISLLPCHTLEIRAGIEESLSCELLRYHSKFGGVLLSYSNLRVNEPYGTLFNENPHIHCRIIMDILVFAPIKGEHMEGKIVASTMTHLTLHVAGLFLASVAAKELPEGTTYTEGVGWKRNDKEDVYGMGSDIMFKVVLVHEANGTIALVGSCKEKE